ncbi:uncharacterized protein LOC129952434 [Eupeodes corollae]|uniref:uncharacterized protein LOC129952434 n=1 Tax=Eupeodes corollae TaxID=290404 RepID=UPI0024926237|nr:uncharacterized protein LOC129952434 [Eupeodes corollae]
MALKINKCCCISLPTACITIGVLGGLISLLKSIECLMHLYHLKDIKEFDGDYYDNRIDIYYVLVPNIVYVITSVLLIIGIRKDSHLLLLPWLIINVIALLLSVPTVLFFFYYSSSRGSTRNLLQIIAIVCVFLGIICWLWIAVYSLFQDIRQKRNEQLPETEKTLMNLYPRYEIVQLNV